LDSQSATPFPQYRRSPVTKPESHATARKPVTRGAADALKMNSDVLSTATNQIADSDRYDSNIGNKNPFTAEPPRLVSTARAKLGIRSRTLRLTRSSTRLQTSSG